MMFVRDVLYVSRAQSKTYLVNVENRRIYFKMYIIMDDSIRIYFCNKKGKYTKNKSYSVIECC